MPTPKRFFVAYDRDGDSPHYLPIPEEDITADVDDPEDRAEFFDSLRIEGAIAAKIIDADGTDERLFPHDKALPTVYVITASEFDGLTPYTTTLQELRLMFPERNLAVSPYGIIVNDRDTGPGYIGLTVREYRRRRAWLELPASIPVVRDGEPMPDDRTYVYVSMARRAYRHEPDAAGSGRLQVVERSRHVIPYVDGKPLWSLVTIDRFASFGEERAIDAAQEAVAIARGVWSYDAAEHYERLRETG